MYADGPLTVRHAFDREVSRACARCRFLSPPLHTARLRSLRRRTANSLRASSALIAASHGPATGSVC